VDIKGIEHSISLHNGIKYADMRWDGCSWGEHCDLIVSAGVECDVVWISICSTFSEQLLDGGWII